MSAVILSNYQPDPNIVDLSDSETRQRLSKSALIAFFNILDKWQLRDEEGRKLLGGMSNGAYYKHKKSPNSQLDQDKLTRISYLLGIYKALHLIHGENLADRWVSMPNRNIIFAGQTPLSYMIRGGMPAMQMVRSLLDGRRGGL